jgi:organic hydroperoxide reductase OsmC/OhrA
MATIRREGSAVWQGGGKDGQGTLTTQSGTLRATPYSFNARFGDGQGTNPEELIAAAHAGCFSMALAFQLSGAGHPPAELATSARLSMEQEGGVEDRRRGAHAARPRAGDRPREVRRAGRGRQGELPRQQGAERRDHAGGDA